ncbi:hypothetical protein IAR55_000117 [Kwoniella newhampshirensis]|uniref:Zn(2)-C6 fungal-type domain-containing protein n=1 Tax=Kwoniella newhampshirensis TaxID=1651941 RepID=A0AAW0Z6C1_9TREE
MSSSSSFSQNQTAPSPAPILIAQMPDAAPSLSRFQQLLRLKLAAEQEQQQQDVPSSTSGHQYTPPLMMTEALARLQAVDTVIHRDFAGRHYTNENGQQQQSVKVEGQSSSPQDDQQPPQLSYGPTAQTFVPANDAGSTPAHPSASSLSSHGYQGLRGGQEMEPSPLTGVYTPQDAMYGQVAQNAHYWNGSYDVPVPNTRPMAIQSKISAPCYVPASPASSQPTLGNGIRNGNRWPVKLENLPTSSQWSTAAHPSQPVTYNDFQQTRSAPSFSWNVSEIRTPANERSYLPQRSYEGTPVSSPGTVIPTSNSITPPAPVTPMGPARYDGIVHNQSSYPMVKVERSPTTNSHLLVPYGSLPGCNMQSVVPPSTESIEVSSPLLEYRGIYTPVHLPGPGMYMSSMNGQGGAPPTLANGMASGNGGQGSSGGSNNGSSGEGWGNGNGGNGEASGSGSGGHGDGNGSGSGGDGGDGGDDGNGGKRGKKLALACHFCRRRKLKCDGIRPKCDNCTKRNETCTWDDNVRRRGPGRATKERREKAAREAIAAGLTNSNSLGASFPTSSSTPETIGSRVPLPAPVSDSIHQSSDINFEQHQEQQRQHEHHQQQQQQSTLPPPPPGYDDDIVIDPTLAALSVAIMPETLAELEGKKESESNKRKSLLEQEDAILGKKPRVEEDSGVGSMGMETDDGHGNGLRIGANDESLL